MLYMILYKKFRPGRCILNKVAIITFCNVGINYGQVLQAYAIQKIVKKYGQYPIIIKYRKSNNNEPIKYLKIPVMKQLYEWYYGMSKAGSESWKIKLKFNRFVGKHINMTIPCYSKEDVEKELENQKCSILFCGSDQIWNPVAFDPVFYLDIGEKQNKRIAYAPSIAEDELNSSNRHIFDKMIPLIEKINYVSVREKSGEHILKQLTDKAVTTVLDPTLLINKKGWDKIASASYSKEKYIFCYVLGDIRQHREMLGKLKQKYKTSKIIYLRTKNDIKSSIEEFCDDIGPEEFISLIKYAQAIYTDSFHGVAFAINYNREFYTCKRFTISAYNKSSRIHNILELLQLENRYIEYDSQIILDDYIPYNEVNNLLQKERAKAFRFLNQAFK